MVAIDVRGALRVERERRAAAQASSAGGQGAQRPPQVAACQAAEQVLRESGRSCQFAELDAYGVATGVSKGLFYIPNFISEPEEDALKTFIDAEPSEKWVAAGERRMLNWGGRPGEARIREDLPSCITLLVERMVSAGVYTVEGAPNHCLVNEYLLGAGILPHQDGALYAPCVATITLEGPALMDFHRVGSGIHAGPAAQVLLKPRALLLMRGEAYASLLHSIPSHDSDTITYLCANQSATMVKEGDIVQRAPKRKSLVFVHKLQHA